MGSGAAAFTPCISQLVEETFERLRLFLSPPTPLPCFDYVNHMIRKKSVPIVNSAHSLSVAPSP